MHRHAHSVLLQLTCPKSILGSKAAQCNMQQRLSKPQGAVSQLHPPNHCLCTAWADIQRCVLVWISITYTSVCFPLLFPCHRTGWMSSRHAALSSQDTDLPVAAGCGRASRNCHHTKWCQRASRGGGKVIRRDPLWESVSNERIWGTLEQGGRMLGSGEPRHDGGTQIILWGME